ncbi:MAG: alpha/beta hydrolase [Minisyncoccia bacterium]
MRQVVAIHGGDAFATHEEYLVFLRDYKIESADYFKRAPDWKANLQAALGADYEVLLPQMPNKWDAKYDEWKLWFEKMFPFLRDDLVLVGHSLGGSFLTRYLSENKFPKNIAATMLVAAPYGPSCEGMLPEFCAPASLALLTQQSNRIFLYHSEDDVVVPFSELAKYQAEIPNAIVRVFPDRQHFNQPEFPELVTDIKNL